MAGVDKSQFKNESNTSTNLAEPQDKNEVNIYAINWINCHSPTHFSFMIDAEKERQLDIRVLFFYSSSRRWPATSNPR